MDSEIKFPPSEGVGYVFVGSDVDQLGAKLAEHNAEPRVAGYLGDPLDDEVCAEAKLMATEMFRVNDVVVIPLADFD